MSAAFIVSGGLGIAVAAYVSSQWMTAGHSQNTAEEKLPLPAPLPGVGGAVSDKRTDSPPEKVESAEGPKASAKPEEIVKETSVPDPALNNVLEETSENSFAPQKVERPTEKPAIDTPAVEQQQVAKPQEEKVNSNVLPIEEGIDLPSDPVLGSQPDFNAQNDLSKDLKSTVLEPYIYDSERRRDPFEPYANVQPLEAGSFQGPLLPLQRYDLDQLSLIGVLWDVKEPKAMFLDPNKKIHILGKDERVGRNSGYIAVIREGEVVVVESVMVRGELSYTTRTLKMTR